MADDIGKKIEDELSKDETDFETAFSDAIKKVPGANESSADELRAAEAEDDSKDSKKKELPPQDYEDPNAKIVDQFSGDSDDLSDTSDYKSLYEQEKAAHDKEKQRTRSWEGRISAANREAGEAKKRADAAEEKVSTLEEQLELAKKNASFFKLDLKDGEAQTLLASLDEDAPDLKKAIIHIASSVAKEIALEAITQYMPNMEPLEKVKRDVEAVKQEVELDYQTKHLATIDGVHPDREEIIRSGVLKKWILSQPSYKQPALKDAYNKGNTQDVIDLIQDFKDATGWVTKPKITETTPTNTHQKSDKERKLDSMLNVKGEHAPLEPGRGTPDKEDFSSAFAEASSRRK